MSERIVQGSPEWFAQRCGKATASKIADIVAKTKSGYAATRANYAAQLVCEQLTGTVQESFTNAAMLWGTEQEPHARRAYEAETGALVEEVGMIDHPTISGSGASPDGLVGSDGLVEFKCPNSATHIDTLLSGEIDKKYELQMAWQMACTGRKWCDFVSFDPRMPPAMQLCIMRVKRDDVLIASLEKEVAAFLAEVTKTVAELRARYLKEAA